MAANTTVSCQTPTANHLTMYKTSMSRTSLKCGYYKPLDISVVRETPLDGKAMESFYHPAVVLLDLMYKAKASAGQKGGD